MDSLQEVTPQQEEDAVSVIESGTLERTQLVTNTTLRMTQGSVSHVHKLYTYICMYVRYSHSYTVTVHACDLSHSK